MIEIISTPWHVFSALIVFLFGVAVAIALARKFSVRRDRAIFLYVWHTAFCMLYLSYVMENGGDAIAYYRLSLLGDFEFEIGTSAVRVITSWFSSGMGMSILGTFLVFNFFGYIGLMAFDASLKTATNGASREARTIGSLVVFLPSASFWSSAIGKDSLSFMAIGLCLWASIDLVRRFPLLAAAATLLFIVRPHIAALLLVALAVSLVISGRMQVVRRFGLVVIAVAAVSVVIPVALEYSGIVSEDETEDFVEFVEKRQAYNMDGGAGIDISSMSLPSKMFTYLFRPLPFEAHNIPAFAASLDNVVLLYLVIVAVMRRMGTKAQLFTSPNVLFLWAYTLSAWISLSMTTSNLGISVRQKWMFLPVLIFLLISMLSSSRRSHATSSTFQSS